MDFLKSGFFGLYWINPDPRFWRMDNMDFFFFKYGGKYQFRLNLPGISPLFGEISSKFIDTGRVLAHSRKFPRKLAAPRT